MAQRFRVNSPGVIDQSVDGEVLIVNLETGFYYSSEGSGDAIWSFIAKGATPQETAAALARSYEAAEPEILAATEAFLAQLLAESLVAPAEGADGLPSVADGAPRRPFASPVLQKYTDMQELLLLDPIHDVDSAGWPEARPGAAGPAL